MREFLRWFFVFVCGMVLVNAGVMYAMYTIDTQIRAASPPRLPEPVPEVVIKPYDDDPLMENMELLKLKDLQHCPRHYLEMQLKGAEYWMHQKTGKIYTKNSNGKLVSAL